MKRFTPSLGLLRVCVSKMDADMGWGPWFRVGAILFYETQGSEDGFALFDRWSSTGTKYKGRKDTWALWKGLRLDHPKPLKMGTLRYMLQKAGHDWDEILVEAQDTSEEQGW